MKRGGVLSSLKSKIDMVWVKKREQIFRMVSENEEYRLSKEDFAKKVTELIEITTPDQQKKFNECNEARTLVEVFGSQEIYQAGFRDGLKTMLQIMNI